MNITLQWAILFSTLSNSVDRPEDKPLSEHREMIIEMTDRIAEELSAINVGLAFILPQVEPS